MKWNCEIDFVISSSFDVSMILKYWPLKIWMIDCWCNFCVGEENLERWKDGISSVNAEAPGPAYVGTLVLAERRTKRPDILSGFRRYGGGWDISNKHYWAVSSVSLSSSCFGYLIHLFKCDIWSK